MIEAGWAWTPSAIITGSVPPGVVTGYHPAAQYVDDLKTYVCHSQPEQFNNAPTWNVDPPDILTEEEVPELPGITYFMEQAGTAVSNFKIGRNCWFTLYLSRPKLEDSDDVDPSDESLWSAFQWGSDGIQAWQIVWPRGDGPWLRRIAATDDKKWCKKLNVNADSEEGQAILCTIGVLRGRIVIYCHRSGQYNVYEREAGMFSGVTPGDHIDIDVPESVVYWTSPDICSSLGIYTCMFENSYIDGRIPLPYDPDGGDDYGFWFGGMAVTASGAVSGHTDL